MCPHLHPPPGLSPEPVLKLATIDISCKFSYVFNKNVLFSSIRYLLIYVSLAAIQSWGKPWPGRVNIWNFTFLECMCVNFQATTKMIMTLDEPPYTEGSPILLYVNVNLLVIFHLLLWWQNAIAVFTGSRVRRITYACIKM